MKADRTIYYSSYTDDVVKSHNQSFKLKTNYEWINNSLLFKMASMVIYVLAIVIGYICCKLFFNISYKNRKLSRYLAYCRRRNKALAILGTLEILAIRVIIAIKIAITLQIK